MSFKLHIFAVAMCFLTAAGNVYAQDQCRNPTEYCSASVSEECWRRTGAGDCAEQMQDYQDCVVYISASCGAPECSEAQDLALWEQVKNSADPADIEVYLSQCPSGLFQPLAQSKLAKLRAAAAPSGDAPAPSGAPSGCLQLPARGSPPLLITVGSKICNPNAPAQQMVVTKIQRNVVAFTNGPNKRLNCHAGESCGPYWDGLSGFQISTHGASKGGAYILR